MPSVPQVAVVTLSKTLEVLHMANSDGLQPTSNGLHPVCSNLSWSLMQANASSQRTQHPFWLVL